MMMPIHSVGSCGLCSQAEFQSAKKTDWTSTAPLTLWPVTRLSATITLCTTLSALAAWVFAGGVVLREMTTLHNRTSMIRANAFIASVLLATASLALGQGNKPATSVQTGEPGRAIPAAPSTATDAGGAKDRNFNPDGSLTVPSDTLGNIVREIGAHVPYWPQRDGAAYTMPNVIFAPGTAELRLPGEITLRGVTPIQTLTLVASAAGCTLEPVVGVREEGDESKKQNDSLQKSDPSRIIGYRIMLSKPAQAGSGMGAGMPGSATPYPWSGGEVHIMDEARPGLPSVDATEARLSLDPAAGASESISFVAPGGSSGRMSHDELRAIEKAATTRLVRVYGLGAALAGTGKEGTEKEGRCADLIQQAIALAELDSKPQPELSFHSELGALIVKATVAQHEIIEQAVKALKENDASRPVPLPLPKEASALIPLPSRMAAPATPKPMPR